MPEQDGYELIEHIRQRDPERGGNIPAVALTANARVEDRVRALRAGFQMYVPKPVVPSELVAIVANLTHRLVPFLRRNSMKSSWNDATQDADEHVTSKPETIH